MSVSIDLKKAHLTRVHGDITVVFSWMNDERAMFLIPHMRPGAPWFVVMESASFAWDDSDPKTIASAIQRGHKACEVLGIEPSPWNVRRIVGMVIDGIPDLVRMPSSPPTEYHKTSYGHLTLKADGTPIAGEDIRIEKTGVQYG